MKKIKEGRISIRDARNLFGRHVVDYVRVNEPVGVWLNGSRYWLAWFSNSTYEILPPKSLSGLRDNGTHRAELTTAGNLLI